MTGRGKIGDGIKLPKGTVAAELRRRHGELGRALAPLATDHKTKTDVIKALAHAVLYLGQRAGLPPGELVAFMRSAVTAYTAHGSGLAISPKARARLENGPAMPVWPDDPTRRAINRALEVIYRHVSGATAPMGLATCWDMLMRNTESIGLTHEALIVRLEVLDRVQRAEGAPEQYLGDQPPSWAREQ